jgi:hypothetical protein
LGVIVIFFFVLEENLQISEIIKSKVIDWKIYMSFTDKHQKHEEEMGCQFFDSMRGHSIQAIKKVGKHIEKNIFLVGFLLRFLTGF